MKKKKGFTLVELIVVLTILAILSALLIPSLTGYIEKAKRERYTLVARNVELAARTVYVDAYAEDGIRLAVIKLNATGNFQKTESGGHFAQLEAVYVYRSNGSAYNLGKDNPIAKKYFQKLMKLVDTGDLYIAGTWIFFDQTGAVVSNTAKPAIGGQGAVTSIVIWDRNKTQLAVAKYNDASGWYAEISE